MSKVEIPVMKKRVGLGRGLGALLQDSDEVNNIQPRVPVLPMERPSRMEQISSMNEISVELIETNPYQPRTHLPIPLKYKGLFNLLRFVKLV
jgi:ParB family transcriptional regulator, chromosome partitioning protein